MSGDTALLRLTRACGQSAIHSVAQLFALLYIKWIAKNHECHNSAMKLQLMNVFRQSFIIRVAPIFDFIEHFLGNVSIDKTNLSSYAFLPFRVFNL